MTVFLLVIKCAVWTGGERENVSLLEESGEPQVGAHPPTWEDTEV